jgi:hypothetical protein
MLEINMSFIIQSLTNDYDGPGDYFSLGLGALLVILNFAVFFMPFCLVSNKHLITEKKFK